MDNVVIKVIPFNQSGGEDQELVTDGCGLVILRDIDNQTQVLLHGNVSANDMISILGAATESIIESLVEPGFSIDDVITAVTQVPIIAGDHVRARLAKAAR